ncbi:hypothetical protein LTR56_019212 [Elasticomyces elasticus]|nr:hypothetical protein LTR56_019212 [Elasticomyces elasticus]
MAEQLVTNMAEQLVTELLGRVHEAERTIVSLKLEAHANQMQLKAAKDEAAAVQHQYLKLLGTQTVELIKKADKVAELEKAIQDITAQESSSLISDVAELKEMLKTAQDLKAAPEPKPPTTMEEKREKHLALYDCANDPCARRAPRQSEQQPPTPVIMPPMAAANYGTGRVTGPRMENMSPRLRGWGRGKAATTWTPELSD